MENKTITDLKYIMELLSNSQGESAFSENYKAWKEISNGSLKSLDLIGELNFSEGIEEFVSEAPMSNEDYPISFQHYPNSRSLLYSDESKNLYLVYREFGGHAPEWRCRQIRKEVIVSE